jgi:hypothetical protein
MRAPHMFRQHSAVSCARCMQLATVGRCTNCCCQHLGCLVAQERLKIYKEHEEKEVRQLKEHIHQLETELEQRRSSG